MRLVAIVCVCVPKFSFLVLRKVFPVDFFGNLFGA